MADELDESAAVAAIIEEAQDRMAQQDLLVAVAYLNGQEEPLLALEAYLQLVKELYYGAKDLASVVALSWAGLQYGLLTAKHVETENAELANSLKQRTRALAYNLASYTWPGWDEPGIQIDRWAAACGLEAAKATVRLAGELQLDEVRHSRAHWMLGAHQMAAGSWEEARDHFMQAATFAEKVGDHAEMLLAQGFGALTVWAETAGDAGATEHLEELKGRLREMKDGEFFVSQIETAARVFTSKQEKNE